MVVILCVTVSRELSGIPDLFLERTPASPESVIMTADG
jgi:hypothetical protein